MKLWNLYKDQMGTVCEELEKHGYIKGEELEDLKRYEATISDLICVPYRIAIAPVVALLRVAPVLLPVANIITRYVWITRAVRLGRILGGVK